MLILADIPGVLTLAGVPEKYIVDHNYLKSSDNFTPLYIENMNIPYLKLI